MTKVIAYIHINSQGFSVCFLLFHALISIIIDKYKMIDLANILEQRASLNYADHFE